MNTDLGKGYPCFVVSIAMIGVCTAVIGDVAGHLGCFIYLKDSVNAIAFVALGTSVPGKKEIVTIRNLPSKDKICRLKNFLNTECFIDKKYFGKIILSTPNVDLISFFDSSTL